MQFEGIGILLPYPVSQKFLELILKHPEKIELLVNDGKFFHKHKQGDQWSSWCMCDDEKKCHKCE